MIATIKDLGHQYRVQEGDTFEIDLREAKEGESVVFDQVMVLEKEGEVLVGTPFVAGAKVTATVLGEAKGDKVINCDFRRRKASRRRIGHRQSYLKVKVSSVEG
ncbi:MAG: 50S ribosomal protein L21 [Planctomycetes bacterium]|nr:50S ribosomal protein L21 [Planctomycetota bacterium]